MADLGTDGAWPSSDLESSLGLVSGRTLLAQDICARLSTPFGSLWYDPDYGYDITSFLNDDVTEATKFEMKAGITKEALKDDRVESVSVLLTWNAQTRSMTVALALTDADGPFDLVLAVSSVTVEILKLAA